MQSFNIDQESNTPIYSSCTIVNTNTKHDDDDQILNPFGTAQIGDSEIRYKVLRDSGSFVSIMKQDLVPTNCYTNRHIKLQFADGKISTVRTALVKMNSDFFTGTMEFAILPEPVTPIIIGNMKHVTENFVNRIKNGNSVSDKTQTTVDATHENKPRIQQTKLDCWFNEQTATNKTITILNSRYSNADIRHINKIEPTSETLIEVQFLNGKEEILQQSQPNNLVDFYENTSLYKTKTNELETLNEIDEKLNVPINAVLTMKKSRLLEDIKRPDQSTQIPDITPKKFNDLQK